ncbi:MAG: hypothetical protein ACE5PV_26060 [Candidatus Poribacteria bacterium]
MKKTMAISMILFVILSTSSVFALEVKATELDPLAGYQIEQITNNSWADYRASLYVDAAGVPHVAWIGSSGGQYEVYYATKEGGSWQITKVTNTSTEKGDAVLALDSSSRPHVAWTERRGGWDVWYGSWDGTNWITQQVTNLGASEMSFPVSIAFDSADVPHIALEGRVGLWGVFYATNKTGNWTTETVSHEDDSAPSIAIDPDDVPHILYSHGWHTTQRLRYASRIDGGWTSEDIFAQAGGHSHRRLYIDSFGVPHIVFHQLPDNYWTLPNPYEYIVLWYGNKSAGSWSFSQIQIASHAVRSEIFLDSEQIPYVVWQSNSTGNSEIYLAKGWDWQPTQVTKTLIDQYEPGLFIDSSDNIHLAWHNHALLGSENAEIYYAKIAPPPPVPTPEHLSVKISGELDYLPWENVKVKVAALVADVITMEPVSGANVTITIYDPEDNLWFSGTMTEKLNRGIYLWESNETVREIFGHHGKGIYVVHVEASFDDEPTVSDILEFHIDPPPPPPLSLPIVIGISLVATAILALAAVYIKKKRSP